MSDITASEVAEAEASTAQVDRGKYLSVLSVSAYQFMTPQKYKQLLLLTSAALIASKIAPRPAPKLAIFEVKVWNT